MLRFTKENIQKEFQKSKIEGDNYWWYHYKFLPEAQPSAIRLGSFLSYIYEPITDFDLMPVFDRNPFIFVVELHPKYFAGVNFHHIPFQYRKISLFYLLNKYYLEIKSEKQFLVNHKDIPFGKLMYKRYKYRGIFDKAYKVENKKLFIAAKQNVTTLYYN